MQLLSKLQESRLQMSLRIKSDSNCWRETRKNILLMCGFLFEALLAPATTRPKNDPNQLCTSSHSARRASTTFLQTESLIKLHSAMRIQPTATLRYHCSRCLQSTGDGGVLQTFNASRELKSHWTSGFVLSSQRTCFSYSARRWPEPPLLLFLAANLSNRMWAREDPQLTVFHSLPGWGHTLQKLQDIHPKA